VASRGPVIPFRLAKWDVDENILRTKVAWTSIARARKQASFAQRKCITKLKVDQAAIHRQGSKCAIANNAILPSVSHVLLLTSH